VAERPVIVDTGPLIAFLDRSEPEHPWALSQFRLLPAPFLTCEPVLAEAFHLVRDIPSGPRQLFHLLTRGAVQIDFAIASELDDLEKLIYKYRDLPMSLADACLVRMSEQYPLASVLTLDRHFRIYRRNGRQPISVIMPD
jgi:predicted nucleic acid-binding protein